MRVAILAAGYGTRLENDLRKPENSSHHHLAGIPKPLLPVSGDSLISHWIRILADLDPLPREVLVVVNALHIKRYEDWLQSLPPSALVVRLLNEGSTSNDTRSGAVACMRLAAEEGVAEHCLVVAGDTLLPPSFILQGLLQHQQERQADHIDPVSVVLSAPVAEEHVSKHGILEVGANGRVVQLLEKPSPEATVSRLQCPCLYLLHAEVLPLLKVFLESRSSEPLSSRDATGHFISYLVDQSIVYHYRAEERYDIGNLQSYVECCQKFQQSAR